jgi:hypothetical protein
MLALFRSFPVSIRHGNEEAEAVFHPHLENTPAGKIKGARIYV